jgi:hypothetical protein
MNPKPSISPSFFDEFTTVSLLSPACSFFITIITTITIIAISIFVCFFSDLPKICFSRDFAVVSPPPLEDPFNLAGDSEVCISDFLLLS